MSSQLNVRDSKGQSLSFVSQYMFLCVNVSLQSVSHLVILSDVTFCYLSLIPIVNRCYFSVTTYLCLVSVINQSSMSPFMSECLSFQESVIVSMFYLFYVNFYVIHLNICHSVG